MYSKPPQKQNKAKTRLAIIGWLALIIMIISYCSRPDNKPKRTLTAQTRSAEEIARDSARYLDCKKKNSIKYCECLVIGARKKIDWADWVAWLDGAAPINADTRSALKNLTYNCQGL